MQKWVTQSVLTPSELAKLVSILYKYITINAITLTKLKEQFLDPHWPPFRG